MAFLMESIFLSQTEKNKDKLLDILSHYYIQILREEKSQKVVASNNLFGALLCVGEHYPYIVDKPACRQYIIDTVNRVRPLLNYYALNNKLGLFCGLGDFGVALSSINRSTGLYSNLLPEFIAGFGKAGRNIEQCPARIPANGKSLRGYFKPGAPAGWDRDRVPRSGRYTKKTNLRLPQYSMSEREKSGQPAVRRCPHTAGEPGCQSGALPQCRSWLFA